MGKECKSCDKDTIPMGKLLHPQFVPRRNQIKMIIKQAAQRPERRRKINRDYYIKYVIAITILWLISDSNVRFYYSNGDLNRLLIYHGLQLISLIIYYSLTHSDPGYLPKPKDKESDDENGVIVEVEDEDKENTELLKTKRKVVDLSAATLPPRFCERCQFFRPKRSKHCYVCDRCVAKYDHHCPLIDHCIGLNNYKLFISYLLAQGLVAFWTLGVDRLSVFIKITKLYPIGIEIGVVSVDGLSVSGCIHYDRFSYLWHLCQ